MTISINKDATRNTGKDKDNTNSSDLQGKYAQKESTKFNPNCVKWCANGVSSENSKTQSKCPQNTTQMGLEEHDDII